MNGADYYDYKAPRSLRASGAGNQNGKLCLHCVLCSSHSYPNCNGDRKDCPILDRCDKNESTWQGYLPLACCEDELMVSQERKSQSPRGRSQRVRRARSPCTSSLTCARSEMMTRTTKNITQEDADDMAWLVFNDYRNR